MLYQRGMGKTWWYRFRFGGRIVHESAKTQSKTVAREAEQQRRRQLEESWNRIEKKKLPPTFERASVEWLRKRAALKASTRETYEHALKHLNAAFGKPLICDIDAPDIAGYQKARAADNAAGATVNKEFTVLASVLADHGLWNGIRRDAKRLEENESAGRALLPDEESRLLRVAAQSGAKQGHWTPIYTVTALGLNTGLRHSEVRKLRWTDIDLGKRVLVVSQTKTEAGSGRPVSLTYPACTALDMWASRFPNRRPDDFAFPACENGHIQPSRPIANWRTAWHNTTSAIECPKCGRFQPQSDACQNSDRNAETRGIISPLVGLRFHDLRHSAATKMLENGIPIATVAQVLGWSASAAIRMAKRYGHIRPEAQWQVLESIATALPEVTGRKQEADLRGDVHQVSNQAPSVN
ncbi:MAG: tyrosine-type recombinase/integrase [Terriglobia bacterium]